MRGFCAAAPVYMRALKEVFAEYFVLVAVSWFLLTLHIYFYSVTRRVDSATTAAVWKLLFFCSATLACVKFLLCGRSKCF